MIDPDLENPRRPARRKPTTFQNWSRPAAGYPPQDDPVIEARLQAAIRLRQIERKRELGMTRTELIAFTIERRDSRTRAFGAIFDWKPGAWFPVHALSPPGKRARACPECCGVGLCTPTWREHLAGIDHYEYYRADRRPVAIVSQPHREAFEHAKKTGRVAEVERERGVRAVEFDPWLGWYAADTEKNPTALVAWLQS